ncbi:F0F1 ATP synthase subunit delta [Chromobacterium subtsugae]|uniref:ATP synthase subunit delta n=1 Tax=Chromobacterium subtsugae TaxID=251747 RepID=A0ABS7FFV6_9NEIS|nr:MULTISPECIES: F0F1 ATP synthase subunit delta [Chromobacterium]KUM05194.1 ATP synthase F0F1 subunit delta [Chromobacterium subtsugae]KZE83665.1 ATP synthase F0F1 subunit delta [Chromobacterium sp. F49]MBW7566702.1 F0F1 ATP synthase subunit delta [Chromobacterium subtsugae]MBW8288385.1 F0F1 ATP synthase subunit delta [Chromobacterium subtsugae]OBU87169.1 ATP synthase F0F1 subunit delta [Chromobacterium subtsugae]
MAELITVARPYAEAVYSLATEQRSLDQWSDALSWLAAMVNNPDLAQVVTNPKHTAQEVEALMLDVLGGRGNEDVKRFIAALIENARLTLLPEIAAQFELLKAQSEDIVDAQVESAFAMSDAQQAELTTTLSKKYGKTVRLDVRENPDLIGGVRVLVGDDVIDASVRGKLQAMAASLKN